MDQGYCDERAGQGMHARMAGMGRCQAALLLSASYIQTRSAEAETITPRTEASMQVYRLFWRQQLNRGKNNVSPEKTKSEQDQPFQY